MHSLNKKKIIQIVCLIRPFQIDIKDEIGNHSVFRHSTQYKKILALPQYEQ